MNIFTARSTHRSNVLRKNGNYIKTLHSGYHNARYNILPLKQGSIMLNYSSKSQFRSILHKFSQQQIHHKSIINNKSKNLIPKQNVNMTKRGSYNLLKMSNSKIGSSRLFFFLQKRLYNRPWARPPSNSFSQSNKFDFQSLHPNNLFGDLPPVIRQFIYINMGIFILHQIMPRFAFQNFVLKPNDIGSGRIYTPLTSIFSHKQFFHLLFNMMVLYFMGPVALRYLSKQQFYALYFGSGILGSLVSWTTMQPNHCSLGASGAIYGLVSFLTMRQPHATILLWFVLPVKMWQMLAFIVLVESLLLSKKLRAVNEGRPYGSGGSYISHEAHLTGVACGVAYHFASAMM